MAQRNRQRYSKKQAGIIEIESQKILDACNYEHCIKYQNYLSASNNSDFFGMNISMNNYVFKIFSKFDDPDEYQGLCPSATVIRECFLNYFETKLESFIDMYMRNLSGEVLSSDHTFKVASLVWIAKNQPFGAFWAVLNEYNEYQGLCPSATVIRECFLNYFETKLESFIDMYMRNLSGEVLSSDHTFKVASLVRIAKNQPFGAFWAVLNEYNEVITMAFVKDKSNACIKPILENLKKRYQLLNKDDPWAWILDASKGDKVTSK
ncbi:2662_t:CDS:2 [Entrophospora sp. SA101]|nr:2662_t:CDS:2 [Entrophospora sp. SA101]